jgi:hypothetical protein
MPKLRFVGRDVIGQICVAAITDDVSILQRHAMPSLRITKNPAKMPGFPRIAGEYLRT